MEYLDNMNEHTKENRALFLGFCKSHRLQVANSLFSKPPEKLVTYKEKVHMDENEEYNGPPYDAIKYAQIDYWLCGQIEQRAISDIQSRLDVRFDSDYFVLECKLNISFPTFKRTMRHVRRDMRNLTQTDRFSTIITFGLC